MRNENLIALRGDKELWKKFTLILKEKEKEVWDVIGPFIEKYVKKHKR